MTPLVMNPGITKGDVIRKMYGVINDPKYTGGCTGELVFSVTNESFEALYHISIKDLK